MTYYWKKNDDIVHWHLQCTQIPIHVRSAPDWVVSEEQPNDKNKCKECREKDIAYKISSKDK